MSDRSRIRPSHRALVPADVSDPLLWRLAVDVLTAHQPGPDDRCANLQCTGQAGPCPAATRAQQAMRAARATTSQVRHHSNPVAPVTGRAAVGHRREPGGFIGWFTTGITQLRSRLPRRTPGAALAAA
ncbi:hypothetical protein [Polymorphospora rubra]|uniref:Uncharacterized protein n=1 Tax=Polymorphospora rubra TaxID=338584 RepID=A0A810N292_9ACTN|nr:hypothetical protein [Polymorphospora rubra]BCJ65665.1 hypothetical protein Prubr_26860 [Polymorphospora rubra]